MICEKDVLKTPISPNMRFVAWESRLFQAVLAPSSESVLLSHGNKALAWNTHQPAVLGPKYNQGTIIGETVLSLQRAWLSIEGLGVRGETKRRKRGSCIEDFVRFVLIR